VPQPFVFIAAIAIVASLSQTASIASKGPDISVRGTYDAKDGHWLRMELENRSSEPIRMTSSFLPWGSTFSTLLVAVITMDPIGPAPSIERNKVQEHPVGREVTVAAGETLEGSIDLDWQFPKLAEWTSRSDVVVFWSYLPRLRDGRQGERLGGFIVVPAKTTASAKAERKE
jgi:hypothetical protein